MLRYAPEGMVNHVLIRREIVSSSRISLHSKKYRSESSFEKALKPAPPSHPTLFSVL